MKKLNNKGFTLIEILAIMAILVILLGIAASVYTKIVLDSSKDAFLAEATVQTQGIKQFIESEGVDVENDNTVYYFDCRIGVERTKSPFEEWDGCYVVVTYNESNQKNTYYWTALDLDGWGVELSKQVTELAREDIKHNKIKTISLGNTIGGRDNVVIYKYDEYADGKYDVESRFASNEMTIEEADPCFDFVKLPDGTYEITDYNASCGTDANVPSLIDGKVVSSIGENAFRNKGLTSITIYYGIKELKNGAIQENKSLKEMRVASTVTKIGDYAFYNCGLKKVTFPEGLQEIGDYSFAYNEITEVHFSTTLQKIGFRAFLNNRLKEVEFNSPVSVSGGAFSDNKLSEEAGFIYAYNKDGTPNYSKLIGYGGESKDVVIPQTKNGIQLKIIGSSCFSDALIKSVVIPEGVTEIQSSAFYNNELETVTLPSTLVKISSNAFRQNYLTEINIPESVTSIGNGAFSCNCIELNSDESYIYAVGDQSTIVSGASGRNGCKNGVKTTGVLKIPATSPDGTVLKSVKSSAFIGGRFTGIDLPTTSQTPNLTLDPNFIVHNAPGTTVEAEGNGFIYGYTDGKREYDRIIAYMGKRPPKDDGIYEFPATKNGFNLKHIDMSLTWSSAKKIIIPETVTKIRDNAFNKTNNANAKLVEIKNLSPTKFDWYELTGSNKENVGKFTNGQTVRHQSGDILIS